MGFEGSLESPAQNIMHCLLSHFMDSELAICQVVRDILEFTVSSKEVSRSFVSITLPSNCHCYRVKLALSKYEMLLTCKLQTTMA